MNPLEQWLSAATRYLSAESAAQVRAEIQQHYDSACEAGDDAIAALGDPRAANRAYRKALLTEQEAMMAPVLTRPKRTGVGRTLLTTALVTALLWFLSRKPHGPVLFPLAIAICCTTPLTWFFSPTTLGRSRTYAYVLGIRDILEAAIAWWYNGWSFALTFGAVLLLSDYVFHHTRLSIFRKLAAGQTYSLLLPGEPRLTRREAIFLRGLQNGGPHENASIAVLFLILAAVTAWQPATFVPVATWFTLDFLARQTLPICAEERSRRYRIAKWTTMAVAAVLPALYGAPMPWAGAGFIAILFVLFDMNSISLRHKLPAAQWPRKLYW